MRTIKTYSKRAPFYNAFIRILLNCEVLQGTAQRALMQGRSLRALECLRRLPMSMTISTRQVGGVTIVDIRGRIVLGEESASVRDVVCDLLSKGHKQILLNLGAVDYIDSMGLGSLVGAFVSVWKQGGELKLLNLTNKVTDVMQITRLYTVFDIMDDEAVAVKSFGQSAAATGIKKTLRLILERAQKAYRLMRPQSFIPEKLPMCPVPDLAA